MPASPWAEGVVVREPIVRSNAPENTVNIGIICYASIGGSGIVATELGKMLALRGHHVHVLSSDTPFRLGDYQPGLSFHRVEAPTYPLFREPQYLLALANKIVQVSRDEHLDIIHAHYAVPHATAAYLARQILAATNGGSVPRVITTLHGTDITLLAADRSYSEIIAFSIQQSDGVTAVSESLKATTHRELGQICDIRVIPNFVDGESHRRPGSHRASRTACARRRKTRHPRLQLPPREARDVGRRNLQADSQTPCAGTAPDGGRRSGSGRARAPDRGRMDTPTPWTSSANSRTWSPPLSSSDSIPAAVVTGELRAGGSKRWRAKCPSSRRASAACRTSSRTASPKSARSR